MLDICFSILFPLFVQAFHQVSELVGYVVTAVGAGSQGESVCKGKGGDDGAGVHERVVTLDGVMLTS